MDLSLLELLLGGGLLTVITGFVTLNATRRKANAEASGSEVDVETKKDEMLTKAMTQVDSIYSRIIQQMDDAREDLVKQKNDLTAKNAEDIKKLQLDVELLMKEREDLKRHITKQSDLLMSQSKANEVKDLLIMEAFICKFPGEKEKCSIIDKIEKLKDQGHELKLK